MSRKTEKLAAAAREAAAKAATDAQKAADKIAATEEAERIEALKTPADRAMERAFARGTLPDADRRAADELLGSARRAPDAFVVDGAVVEVGDGGQFASIPGSSFPAQAPDGSPVTFVETDAPPTGVRSPATREIDSNALSGAVFDSTPGTTVPPLRHAPSAQPVKVRLARDVAGVAQVVPNVPASVETRGPLVPLVPLSEVHPSTVESAISDQRIPNDQINAVFADADGVKRDALGHPFSVAPTPPPAPSRTRGVGFDE